MTPAEKSRVRGQINRHAAKMLEELRLASDFEETQYQRKAAMGRAKTQFARLCAVMEAKMP